MNRKISIFIFALILLLFSLSGCQLAEPDAGGEDEEGDRLVGVYVTREHLDLFDLEGYLNDNPALLTGGHIEVDGAQEKYNGRIYAALQTRTLTDDEGNPHENQEYVFEGVDGIALFCVRLTDPAGNTYTSASTGEGIGDGSYKLGDETELEGTIYVAGGRAEFYFNPVYQSADGSVYLTAGQGTSGDLTGASSFSHSMEESYTVTEGDEARTKRTSVKITVQGMSLPEQLTLVQMGADNMPLYMERLRPEAVPETVALDADAAYLVVETLDADQKITRALYERGEEPQYFTTYVPGEDGICLPRYAALDWAAAD